MTDRLSDLIHREATDIAVPPASTSVVALGRRIRRHRRVAVAGGVVGVVAMLTGVGLVASQHDDTRAIEPATPVDVSRAVFSVGTTVYLDGGSVAAPIDDAAIKSLKYTSLGVVVQHGDNPYRFGGGAQRYSLVTWDGRVRDLGLSTTDVEYATDPGKPLLAYVEETPQGPGLAVVDLADGSGSSMSLDLDGDLRFRAIALDGENAYIQDGEGVAVVDLPSATQRSDISARISDLVGDSTAIAGDVAIDYRDESLVVLDSGERLFEVPDPSAALRLSPDGSTALLLTAGGPTSAYDVASGTSTPITDADATFWWTADGDIFTVTDDGTLRACDTGSGECVRERLDLPVLPNSVQSDADFDDVLNLAGQSYES
ncbi:hypothetical protein [Nocardioides sp. R-C-SC26]|uniref:hypothetical protein n=1 Tax=Nocardioides sp. R-C-SC26 TaxID=2870414 RepID=UPI001E3D1821|nr:hypothetical protein [Nocardioides sp. R-C-SC26]